MHSTHLSANEMKLDLGKWTLFMSWPLDMLLMLRAPKFCPKMFLQITTFVQLSGRNKSYLFQVYQEYAINYIINFSNFVFC